MKINELLEKSRKQTESLLTTNKGTKKESIYKDSIFEGLSDKQKKSARKKVRNYVHSIFESLIFADKENIYNQILKIKMSELNQEQISLIDNDYEAEEEEVSYSQYSLYCSNIKTLIDKITKNYFNENKIANDTLLKVIINYSDKDAFDESLK